MKRYSVFLIVTFIFFSEGCAPPLKNDSGSQPENIISLLHKVNRHFQASEHMQVDRNWKRGTYYTGLMAFYKATGDTAIFEQVHSWGAKHGWRTGTEWVYPANRLTCSQTYLELYFMIENPHMIKRTKSFMDKRVRKNKNAFDAGWFYVDALYVGTPAYVMMTRATGDSGYAAYGHRMFREVTDSLFNRDAGLYYRDLKAKKEQSPNGEEVFWSRGNGWVFASIPRIIDNLSNDDPAREWYLKLFKRLAESIYSKQSPDGLWRSSLSDPEAYPMPESSGSAFFTYGLAWGINSGILEKKRFLPVVLKSWNALYDCVDDSGKVTWGQKVARGPGVVKMSDSDEFVAGAFLLAGSEMLRLIQSEAGLSVGVKE
jgi:rhamnogalacturonyl hydrolase YesR